MPIWLVGHSRGTFSATNGAIRLGDRVDGLVLTSTVTITKESYAIFKTHPNGVLNMELDQISDPTLIAANKLDGCFSTPASNAKKLADALTGTSKKSAVVFDGGGSKDRGCKWGGHIISLLLKVTWRQQSSNS